MSPADDQIGALISSRLRDVPDFPIPGVMFKDITPLLADADGFGIVLEALVTRIRAVGPVDLIAGVEARGFVVAGALGALMDVGMVPVRKAGKLPPPVHAKSYDLEYGSATIEVPIGLLEGKRVFLVDDILATGGTLRAAADLLETAGATVVGIAVVAELSFLPGRATLAPREVTSLHTI
jgi:adenine phosphoribosyltransferase